MKQVLALLLLALPIWAVDLDSAFVLNSKAVDVGENIYMYDSSMEVCCGPDFIFETGMYYPWVKVDIPQNVALDGSYMNDEGVFVYRSELDSMVAVILDFSSRLMTLEGLQYKAECPVHLAEDSSSFVEDSPCPHNWDLEAVLLFELSRLQTLGVLKISAEEADSIAEVVSSRMESALDSGADFEFLVYRYDAEKFENKDTAYVQKTTIASALSYFPELTGIAQKNKGRGVSHVISLGQKTFLVTGTKPGASYRLFSANGVLLKSGRLESGGKIQTPTVPAVLKVDGGKAFWLK